MGISCLISLALHCKLQHRFQLHILSNCNNEDEDEDGEEGDEDDSIAEHDDVDI